VIAVCDLVLLASFLRVIQTHTKTFAFSRFIAVPRSVSLHVFSGPIYLDCSHKDWKLSSLGPKISTWQKVHDWCLSVNSSVSANISSELGAGFQIDVLSLSLFF